VGVAISEDAAVAVADAVAVPLADGLGIGVSEGSTTVADGDGVAEGRVSGVIRGGSPDPGATGVAAMPVSAPVGRACAANWL
jgi:hypothetical protein